MKKTKIEKIYDKLIKSLGKPPKLKVIPLMKTKDEERKAEILSKLLEQNWNIIEQKIKSEIYQPMIKCFMIGNHVWRGFGRKGYHKCKICGWITSTINDPIYLGELKFDYLNSQNGKEK